MLPLQLHLNMTLELVDFIFLISLTLSRLQAIPLYLYAIQKLALLLHRSEFNEMFNTEDSRLDVDAVGTMPHHHEERAPTDRLDGPAGSR